MRSEQWTVNSGRRAVDSGQWTVDSEQWGLAKNSSILLELSQLHAPQGGSHESQKLPGTHRMAARNGFG